MKIILLVIMLVFLSCHAFAYTIDGDLSDWGVDLSAGLSGSESAWVPNNKTIDWKVEDNIDPDCPVQGVMPNWKGHNCLDWSGYQAVGVHIEGTGFSYSTYDEPVTGDYEYPAGGENLDIEAMYFDDDPQYGYFAIVISMPPGGTNIYGRHIDPGDLAIDMDNNISTGEYGYEYGIKLSGANQGQVCYLPDWSIPTDFPSNKPSTFTCGNSQSTVVGNATLVYVNAGVSDNGVDNYIIEIKVGRPLIGSPTSNQINNLHTTLTCGNDEIDLDKYEWDYDIPEFTTIGAALVLLGAGLYVVKKRRKR